MLEKHSISIAGHASSVTLEPEFWRAFRALAQREGLTLNAMATRIDAERDLQTNLASAIRLTVLRDLQSRLDDHGLGDIALSSNLAHKPDA